MSMMYCTFCDKPVDTDFMDHCEWGPFKCEVCVDNEHHEQEYHAWWQQIDNDTEYQELENGR